MQTEFPRSWLLPLLRDNTRGARLGYFISDLLPMAANLLAISEGAASQDQALVAKTYHVLYTQVWALLPGFCTDATDLAISFKSIAKVLGMVLTQREELRTPVCLALQNAICSAAGSCGDCFYSFPSCGVLNLVFRSSG